jgi:hypothetical protein
MVTDEHGANCLLGDKSGKGRVELAATREKRFFGFAVTDKNQRRRIELALEGETSAPSLRLFDDKGNALIPKR